ncbi:MAG: isopentenyl transferase family protein, partial [Armatimonadota bacterium]
MTQRNPDMDSPNLIAIMGPTASGKSQVAEAIANRIDAAIINADAFQIYRGMDVGTGKSSDLTRYQLIDIRNPDQDFGVGEFVVLAADLLHEHFRNGKSVVICGGTGLYVRALIEQYGNLMPAPSPE